MSDISQVFDVDDIFTFWLAISGIVRVKTPIVPPWLFIVDCQMISTQFSRNIHYWGIPKIMDWDGKSAVFVP